MYGINLFLPADCINFLLPVVLHWCTGLSILVVLHWCTGLSILVVLHWWTGLSILLDYKVIPRLPMCISNDTSVYIDYFKALVLRLGSAVLTKLLLFFPSLCSIFCFFSCRRLSPITHHYIIVGFILPSWTPQIKTNNSMKLHCGNEVSGLFKKNLHNV